MLDVADLSRVVLDVQTFVVTLRAAARREFFRSMRSVERYQLGRDRLARWAERHVPPEWVVVDDPVRYIDRPAGYFEMDCYRYRWHIRTLPRHPAVQPGMRVPRGVDAVQIRG